ncbi:MAG TPA: FtsQ-type POTRA domain-containing protein [Thermoanaerobaculia bacterium]|nr:FtsQ-type POTRA domain-containing protein [Thermoanaerobaculia bacterium]
MTLRDPLAADGKVLPFRRRSSAVRVRRRNPWLALAAPLAKTAFAIGAPVALGLWLFTSPTFALGRVEVEGNRYVAAAEIERALDPFHGDNLLRLSLPAVERVLAKHPWIATVGVEKQLPDRLRVAIVERRPAALLRTAGGFVVLDPEGRRISPWRPGLGGGDLLLVSIGSAAEVDLRGALAVADELGRAAPEWALTLSEVEALSEEDFRLYLGALPFPLLVRGGTLGARLPALRALLPELERRYAGLYAVDLRFERRIVFQPIVERS